LQILRFGAHRRTHFPVDSRNENLPEKRIHRNCAGRPGRDAAPGFLLRGRVRRVSRFAKKQENTGRLQPRGSRKGGRNPRVRDANARRVAAARIQRWWL
jgi:hypothetical protein